MLFKAIKIEGHDEVMRMVFCIPFDAVDTPHLPMLAMASHIFRIM